jgi:RNA polymerase sigma-B factor
MSKSSTKNARITRERLVESHLPLVRSLARRYAGQGESLDDLMQVGAVGLVKAGNRFDKSRGVAFATFAGPVIEGEIRRHLRDRSAPMRIPRDLQRASGELRRQQGRLTATIGRSPSMGELAAALNTDEGRIERALRAELARKALPLPGDEEDLGRLDDAARQGSSEDRLAMAECMRALDERERKIVFLRFHADMTERQIGSELGISQAQVSRLLSGALARLRAELAGGAGDGSTGDTAVIEAISSSPAAAGTSAEGASEAAGAPSPAAGSSADVAGSSADAASSSAEPSGPAAAASTGDPAHADPANAEHGPAGARKAAGKIAAVPVTEETLTVGQYLELPYTIAVQSEREGEAARWSATVEELPGCASHGRTPDEAVELLRPAMVSWLEAAIAQRREIPVPGGRAAAKKPAASSHSGRFLVRMPGALHAQLASAAEREQLSLNRFVTNVLAASVSPGAPSMPGAHAQASSEVTQAHNGSARTPSRAFRIALAINIAVVVLAAAAAIVLFVLALAHGV